MYDSPGLSISYLGNQNTHLWLGRALNPATYIPGTSTGINGSCGPLTTATGLPAAGKACSSTDNSNARTRLSLLNYANGSLYSPTMTQVDDGATSSYHGVIASVQHRMSGSFSFLANYTWSHCISPGDTNGDISAPVYQDPNNPRGDRGPCGYDARHIFNTTIVARSNFHGLGHLATALVNRWEIAPLVRITSGTPFNITSGTDRSLSGQGLDRPNLMPGAQVYTGRKITRTASLVTACTSTQAPSARIRLAPSALCRVISFALRIFTQSMFLSAVSFPSMIVSL
jgi:hypothetical protein